MRLTRLVASLTALCLMTGLIVYGSITLWPQTAGSSPFKIIDQDKSKYLFSIGGIDGPTRPNAVTVDKDGRIYVTDAGTAKVFVYSPGGRKLFEFGGTGPGNGKFGFPNGVITTKDGNLVIADSLKNDIKLFDNKGNYLRTILKSSENIRPGSLSNGTDGQIFVSDLLGNKIIVINQQGKILQTIVGEKKQMSYPQGIAVDKHGRLWVADGGNYSVRIFNKTGQEIKEIKGGGVPETAFSMVRGITFDKMGKAYVADTISHQVRVFDGSGKQVSLLKSSAASQESLVFPTGLFADGKGKLFIVDRGDAAVKVFEVPE